VRLVRLYSAAISLLLAAGLCQSSFGQYYYGGEDKIPRKSQSIVFLTGHCRCGILYL
jgi:hypothetical protein